MSIFWLRNPTERLRLSQTSATLTTILIRKSFSGDISTCLNGVDKHDLQHAYIGNWILVRPRL